MKIMVKVKFGCTTDRFEKFDFGKFIAYVSGEENDNSYKDIQILIARSLGFPPSKVEFAGKDGHGYYVYEA